MVFPESASFKSYGAICRSLLPSSLPGELSTAKRDSDGFFSTRKVYMVGYRYNNMTGSSLIIVHCQRSFLAISAYYCIAGNFRGRKLSRISRFFSHLRKFSPRNSRHATPIMRPVLTFHESFLCEMLLSYRSAKVFSLENFPLYGINCLHSIVHVILLDIACIILRNHVQCAFLWLL